MFIPLVLCHQFESVEGCDWIIYFFHLYCLLYIASFYIVYGCLYAEQSCIYYELQPWSN